jgi:hypothetical protein
VVTIEAVSFGAERKAQEMVNCLRYHGEQHGATFIRSNVKAQVNCEAAYWYDARKTCTPHCFLSERNAEVVRVKSLTPMAHGAKTADIGSLVHLCLPCSSMYHAACNHVRKSWELDTLRRQNCSFISCGAKCSKPVWAYAIFFFDSLSTRPC